MCVSAAPAQFTGTILYLGRHQHPQHGEVEVLGYQNTVVDLSDGPNAMLLHVPASELTQANFLDTSDRPGALQDMVDALGPAATGTAAVEVFEHDVYTVVVAADPRDIPAALQRVPEQRRPVVSPELVAFYAERFPLYPVAVCCFDNADARRAAPLLLWYRPIYDGRMTAPALHAPTGAPPDARELVEPDHWVVIGVDGAPEGAGTPVSYRQDPGPLAPFLPRRVIGRAVTSGSLPNGDFAIPVADARAARIEGLVRVTPDGQRVPLPSPAATAPDAPAAQRPWLRPVVLAALLAVLVVVCGWVLLFGP